MSARRILRGLALVLIALAVSVGLPLLYGGVDILARIPRLPPWLLVAAPGLMLCAWAFSGLRVRLLVQTHAPGLGLPRACLLALAAEFGGAIGPAGITGVASFAYLLRGVRVRSANAIALYAVDKLSDQIVFAAILLGSFGALIASRVGGDPRALLAGGLGFSLLAIGALAALLRYYRGLLRALMWALSGLSVGVRPRRRIVRWLLQFRGGLLLIARLPGRRLFELLLFAAGYWTARLSVLPVVVGALGESLPLSYLIAAQVLLIFAGQVSVLPGGTLSVEVAFAFLLAPWLDRQALALTLLLWRGAVFYFTLLAGGPALVFALAQRDDVRSDVMERGTCGTSEPP